MLRARHPRGRRRWPPRSARGDQRAGSGARSASPTPATGPSPRPTSSADRWSRAVDGGPRPRHRGPADPGGRPDVARLADWQVATPRADRVEQIEAGAQAHRQPVDRGAAHRRARSPTPFERLLVYAWRRHLAAALGPARGARRPTTRTCTPQVTVGFADLVNFSALSNELDERPARRPGGDLRGPVRATSSPPTSGRVIKTLGDSVLFVAERRRAGHATSPSGIIDVIGGDARLPDVRIGLATGPVVMRLGDVFGPPVNLAARLTARRPPQPGDRRPGDRRRCCRPTSSRPGG